MKKPVLNYEQMKLEAMHVADIYHKLTLDLFDRVVDRLLERGPASLEENPYIWQLEKLHNMGLLNESNLKLIAERSKIAEEKLREVIEGEGYRVYKDTKQQLAEQLDKPVMLGDNQIMERLIALSNQTFREVDNIINTSLPMEVRKVYQSIVEETVAEVAIGTMTADQALNKTVMRWRDKGFYGFTDRSGKRWKADTYARNIIKSTTYRAFNEARTSPAKELGIDTFHYSMKATAREMCAPLQNQIVTTEEARTENGVKILALSDYGHGTPGGCLGINCGHVLTPFLPGINEIPELPDHLKDLTPEQAIENANIQAKQRALERDMRLNKERLHVAKKLGDKDLIDKYKLRGVALNDAMNQWVKKHPFLYRDKVREKSLTKMDDTSTIKSLFSDIIGMSTSDGILIKSVSEHTLDRVLERKIAPSNIRESLGSPLEIKDVVYDDQGRPSKKYIGAKVTVAINPEARNIVTVHKTRKNIRKKYGVDKDEAY